MLNKIWTIELLLQLVNIEKPKLRYDIDHYILH